MQSSKWGARNVKVSKATCNTSSSILLRETESAQFLYELGYVDSDDIFRTKSVAVNGVDPYLNAYGQTAQMVASLSAYGTNFFEMVFKNVFTIIFVYPSIQ